MLIIIKHEKEVLVEELTDKDTAFLTRIKPNILSKEHNTNGIKVCYASFVNKECFGRFGMSSVSSYALIMEEKSVYSKDEI